MRCGKGCPRPQLGEVWGKDCEFFFFWGGGAWNFRVKMQGFMDYGIIAKTTCGQKPEPTVLTRPPGGEECKTH